MRVSPNHVGAIRAVGLTILDNVAVDVQTTEARKLDPSGAVITIGTLTGIGAQNTLTNIDVEVHLTRSTGEMHMPTEVDAALHIGGAEAALRGSAVVGASIPTLEMSGIFREMLLRRGLEARHHICGPAMPIECHLGAHPALYDARALYNGMYQSGRT